MNELFFLSLTTTRKFDEDESRYCECVCVCVMRRDIQPLFICGVPMLLFFSVLNLKLFFACKTLTLVAKASKSLLSFSDIIRKWGVLSGEGGKERERAFQKTQRDFKRPRISHRFKCAIWWWFYTSFKSWWACRYNKHMGEGGWKNCLARHAIWVYQLRKCIFHILFCCHCSPFAACRLSMINDRRESFVFSKWK